MTLDAIIIAAAIVVAAVIVADDKAPSRRGGRQPKPGPLPPLPRTTPSGLPFPPRPTQ